MSLGKIINEKALNKSIIEFESVKAKENTPLPGMDINPYPLGDIFEMWAKDSA